MSQEPEAQREESPDTGDDLGIADDQLPEDLQPTEDNPLARPADDEVPDDILTEGVANPDSGGDSEDSPDRGVDGASDTPSQGESSETGSARAPAEEPEDSAGG